MFNPSGQLIELEDLLVVCRRTEIGWEPCGNPVKDAMVTKVTPTTNDVIAVLYAPSDEPLELVQTWADRYARALAEHCGARTAGHAVPAHDAPAGLA